MRLTLPLALLAALAGPNWTQAPPADPGHRLERLSWKEAEPLLTDKAVVVIPLASASTEHGPHLPLRADLTIAEFLAGRVVEKADVVVAPAITYHYAPGFFEYPGSATLTLPTARDVVVEVVRSLARYGPRRFYVLATSLSAERALEPAAATLAGEGVLLRYTRYGALLERASRGIRRQAAVGHADEVETSILLTAAPDAVEMSKAVRDLSPAEAFGRLTRTREGTAIYSPSGTWGDPTQATGEKGRAIADSLVSNVVQEIEDLRRADLPSATTRPVAQMQAPRLPAAGAGSGVAPQEQCTDEDARTIRAIGDAFTTAWAAADAQRLGGLWSLSGNIIHPDGLVEQGSVAITQARTELFARREYRGSRHPLTLAMVKCLASNVAVADGRWELRGITNNGAPVPTLEGMCTLVVRRSGGGGWQIEAYRYSIKTPPASVPPNVLKRPGYPGGPVQ